MLWLSSFYRWGTQDTKLCSRWRTVKPWRELNRLALDSWFLASKHYCLSRRRWEAPPEGPGSQPLLSSGTPTLLDFLKSSELLWTTQNRLQFLATERTWTKSDGEIWAFWVGENRDVRSMDCRWNRPARKHKGIGWRVRERFFFSHSQDHLASFYHQAPTVPHGKSTNQTTRVSRNAVAVLFPLAQPLIEWVRLGQHASSFLSLSFSVNMMVGWW